MLKPKPKLTPEPILMTFKLTPAERRDLQAKADEYTNGNVSAWLRYAALNCVPPAEDLEDIIPEDAKRPLGF